MATILLAAFGATIARAGATDDRIAALQAKFRCPIFNYLEAIHNYPTPERIDNRFLIIMIAHRVDERYYAQCAFDSGDARMICELDSPFFNPSMKKYFRGDKLKLVKALGYRLHRKSNYYQYHDARRRRHVTRSPGCSSKRSDVSSTCEPTRNSCTKRLCFCRDLSVSRRCGKPANRGSAYARRSSPPPRRSCRWRACRTGSSAGRGRRCHAFAAVPSRSCRRS